MKSEEPSDHEKYLREEEEALQAQLDKQRGPLEELAPKFLKDLAEFEEQRSHCIVGELETFEGQIEYCDRRLGTKEGDGLDAEIYVELNTALAWAKILVLDSYIDFILDETIAPDYNHAVEDAKRLLVLEDLLADPINSSSFDENKVREIRAHMSKVRARIKETHPGLTEELKRKREEPDNWQ